MASNRKNAKFDIFTKIALIFVIAIIILLVLLPLANIFKFAMDPGGRVIFTDLPKSLVDQEIVKNTLKLGLTVGTLGTLLGFFLAYTQTRIEFKGKRILHVINLIPIISPPFALATAVIVLFGRSGLITRDLLGLRPNKTITAVANANGGEIIGIKFITCKIRLPLNSILVCV